MMDKICLITNSYIRTKFKCKSINERIKLNLYKQKINAISHLKIMNYNLFLNKILYNNHKAYTEINNQVLFISIAKSSQNLRILIKFKTSLNKKYNNITIKIYKAKIYIIILLKTNILL